MTTNAGTGMELDAAGPRPLPPGWRWVRLSEVCQQDRKVVKPGSEPAVRLPYLGLEHVERNTGRILKDLSHVPEGEGMSTTFAFDARHVLYSRLRPYLNKVAMPDFAGRCTTEMIPLRPSPGVDRAYLCWILRRQETADEAMHGKTGSRMPRVGMSELLALSFPLPPLTTQKRIASLLKEQLAAVGKARAAAQARLEAAKALPAVYLRQVLSSVSARRWPAATVGSLGDQSRGDTVQTGPFGAQLHSTDFVCVGVPVLNIGNVQWGHLDCTHLDHVAEEKAAELARYRVREGDLLFTRSGTIGRCAVVPKESDGWLISYHLLRIAFDQRRVWPEFMAAAIRGCDHVLAQVRVTAGRGATRDGVNSSLLSALIVPTPPLSEQRRIAATLREQLVTVEKARRALEEQLDHINALPAAILRRAFEGEL